MKRYAINESDIFGFYMVEDDNGEWVKAEVAQALYDALSALTKESDVWAKVVQAYQNSEPLANAHKALSLADGGE